MALPVTITGISTAVAPVGPFKATRFNPGTTLITIGVSPSGTDFGFGATTNGLIGQSFTTTTATILGGVTIRLRILLGSPTDGVKVDVYAVDGSGFPTGASLGTSNTISVPAITTTYANFSFLFATAISLSASTQYVAVVSRTGALTDTNYFGLSGASAAYASGTCVRTNAGLTGWFNASTDTYFVLFGADTTTSDAYYFFGRDATTATTLQAYKANSSGLVVTGTGTAGGFGNVGGSSGTSRRAQTWITDASATPITDIGFILNKTGSPTDDIKVEIFATSAGAPTGSALATSNVINASSIVVGANNTFTFSTPFTPSASTVYAAVLSRTGALDSVNLYTVAASATTGTSTYAGGNLFTYSVSWLTQTNDLSMVVNGQAAGDPSSSWSSIANRTGFTTAILNIAGYQVGNVIHLAVQDGTMSSSVATKYLSFDAATDTFLATTETVSAAAALTGTGAGNWGCSLVVRSNGRAVLFYNGVQTKTSGTFYARVYYRERTGVNTYGTETEVDTVPAWNATSPIAVLGASDRVHFVFMGFTSSTTIAQRHLTSANVLGTANSSGVPSASILSDVNTRDDAGTIRHIGFTGGNAFRWASADNPTITNVTITSGLPTRTVDDNGIVYILYRDSVTSDLFVKSSSDSGATWGTAVLALGGTVLGTDADVSKNQHAYTRGNSVVIPYLVNDNSVLKYNEYVVRYISLADAWNPNDKTSGITLSNSDKTATSSGSGGAVRSTTSHPLGTAAKFYAEFLISNAGGVDPSVGLKDATALLANNSSAVYLAPSTGNIANSGSVIGNVGSALVSGDVACFAVDMGAESLWIRKNNGLWNNDAAANPATGTNGLDISSLANNAFCLWDNTTASAGRIVTLRTRTADLTAGGYPSGFTSWMGEALPAGATAYTMPAATGAFALTGINAALTHPITMPTTVGAFTLTGIDATFTKVAATVRLNAVTGAFNLSGTTTYLVRPLTMPTVTGAFTLSGTAILSVAMPTSVGAFTTTGIAAALKFARGFPAVTGSFTLSGKTANLLAARRLSVSVGTFTTTGIAAKLFPTRRLLTTVGPFNFTGIDANLFTRLSSTMPAVTGAFTVSGTATSLKFNHVLKANAGTFTYTGQTAGLKFSHRLVSNVTPYTMVGVAAGLIFSRVLGVSAGTGVFNLSGKTVTFRNTYAVKATTGTFTFNGIAANLKAGHVLTASTTPFTLSGQAATLKRIYVMPAATGAFALAGQAATLKRTYVMPTSVGAFALSGQAATLKRTYVMLAATGAFTLDGTATTLRAGRTLAVTSGSFTLNGVAANFRTIRALVTVKGSFTLTGTAANLRIARVLVAAKASFTLNGINAILKYTRVMPVTKGTFALNGVTVNLVYSNAGVYSMPALPGVFTLSGKPALFRNTYAVRITTTTFALSGSVTNLKATRRLTAATGNFAFTGVPVGLKSGRKSQVTAAAFIFSGKDVILVKTGAVLTGVNVWNGSGWAVKPVKVWTGAAWQQKPVKIWDGSLWQ